RPSGHQDLVVVHSEIQGAVLRGADFPAAGDLVHGDVQRVSWGSPGGLHVILGDVPDPVKDVHPSHVPGADLVLILQVPDEVGVLVVDSAGRGGVRGHVQVPDGTSAVLQVHARFYQRADVRGLIVVVR